MALHARLVAPSAPPAQEWPWHEAKWMSLPLRDLWSGDRRMEAESYLSGGYGLRLAIERHPTGWRQLSALAHVSQPSRLKGIQVDEEYGTPFLTATQVFDIRPVPRKWLSLVRTPNAKERFVQLGQILVTCSGAVGRATLASQLHDGKLISHDLLRVDARDKSLHGWLYAYLRAPQTRAMMSSAQYGHIIKHLETSHLGSLPVPEVDAATAADFERRVARLLELRNETYRHTLEAEKLFESALGPLETRQSDIGFVTKISASVANRRRLEANFHAPTVTAILNRAQAVGTLSTVDDVTDGRVWWMTRFKRYFGEGGISYISADELFSINPSDTKRILVNHDDNHERYFMRAGWLAMARSGQTYGLNGSAMLVTSEHERRFFSDDLIRIVPNKKKIRPGYLLTALTHPSLGRPLVIRNAYGTSIPHLEPADVSAVPVVRFSEATETAIADQAEASAEARAQADTLERGLAEDAGQIIDQFLSSGTLESMNPAVHGNGSNHRPATLAEHARVRLRHGLPEHHLRRGATGTIVHVYSGGAGLEVEFGASGKSPKVVTLDGDAVEPIAD